MRISKVEIQKSYALLKKYAKQALEEGKIDEAQEYIRSCVVLASQFNWIYTDDDLEELEKMIGENLIVPHADNYQSNKNRVVFFDDYCITFVLAIQYITALINAGKEVLFVTCRPYLSNGNGIIFGSHINSIKGLQVARITEEGIPTRLQKIYDTIVAYRPSQLFLHIETDSVILPVLTLLPVQITKYLINLQDQTFWLGKKGIDYCIEFRSFGASVSLDRRGLKREQLLMLPFYPIQDKNPFEGFPKEAEGHITIFSGGDIYKTMDSKRVYWKLIKRILDEHQDVVFLFATKKNPIGRKAIDEFVSMNHFENRFIYVGFRKDIYECLKHCDIYMGTCPTSGSLMSQLAAVNATPILQYYYPDTPDDETEQALCVNEKFQISYQDEDAFMQEADRLISDAAYRKVQGKRIQASMIQPEQFDTAVKQIVETNTSPYPITTCNVDHQLIEERWYELVKNGLTDTLSYVFTRIPKTDLLRYIPSLYLKKQILTFRHKLGI